MIEIIASFWENRPILGKFDLCWPVTSILTSSKNDPYVFCRTWHGLSNAVYRFSMRCVVLEISRGVEINSPPPPVLGWLRPPPVRGIILKRLFDQNVRRHWFSVIFRTLANVVPKLKLELNHSIGIKIPICTMMRLSTPNCYQSHSCVEFPPLFQSALCGISPSSLETMCWSSCQKMLHRLFRTEYMLEKMQYLYVTEKKKVHATTDRSELLITWALAHTVFQFKFKKEQTTMGVVVFNRVCGFWTKDPPRVRKVMKALK